MLIQILAKVYVKEKKPGGTIKDAACNACLSFIAPGCLKYAAFIYATSTHLYANAAFAAFLSRSNSEAQNLLNY
jgi:hypothetical protein